MWGFMSMCFALWLFSDGVKSYKIPDTCQTINITMCNSILPYNLTKLPNYLKHQDQASVKAYLESDDITKLANTSCSADLVFFICVLHLPICVKEFQGPVLPCRKLCEKVRRECLPTIKQHGREWPIDIECAKFPNYEKGVCMKRVIVHNNLNNDTSKQSGHGLKNRKGSCRCKTDKQMIWSVNRFDNRAYDFVIIAQVSRILTTANQKQITLTNIHTFREGKVRTNKRSLTILVNSSCPCPYLKNNYHYVIMGREDQARKRLVLNRKSFVYQIRRMKNLKKLKKLKHLSLKRFLMSLKYKGNKSSNKG